MSPKDMKAAFAEILAVADGSFPPAQQDGDSSNPHYKLGWIKSLCERALRADDAEEGRS